MFIIIFYFLTSFTITTCMDIGSRIIASDNKEFIFPQWKIEASRLIHRKQELQKAKEIYYGAPSAPIMLKTICSKKLKLFSSALTKKNFSQHFTDLHYEKQRLLTCVVGENELDSPVMTINLLKYYFRDDFLQQNIITSLPIFDVVDKLHYLAIIDNCKTKKFEIIKNCEKIVTRIKLNGDYNRIPLSLTSGASYISSIDFEAKFENIAQKEWLLEKIKIIENKDEKKYYRITPAVSFCVNDSASEDNKKNLWITNEDCSQALLKKVIKHTNTINHMLFSNNGKFLATTSFAPLAALILTDLSVEGWPDAFLTEHSGDINAISFNDESTLLAVGSANGIQFWDIEKKILAKIFDDCVGKPSGRCVFGGNKLFAACVFSENVGTHVKLWDISDISSIQLINSILDYMPKKLWFDPACGKLIAMTKRNVVVIDTCSGDIVMQTDSIPGVDWEVHMAVLMSEVDILVVAAIAEAPVCCIKLWDIKSGALLTTLLENQEPMKGVGANARRVISVFDNGTVVETCLYNKYVGDALAWLDDDKVNMLQRYFLQRLHRAHENNEIVAVDPDSPEQDILQSLPIKPNAKALVEKYLLKK